MSKASCAVLVSGGGTNLQALIDAERAGKLPHVAFKSVIASRPDAYALTRAEKAGIPGYVVARKGMTQEAFEQGILELLEKHRVPLCCYGHLHGKIRLGAFNGRRGATQFRLLSADFVGFAPVKILN